MWRWGGVFRNDDIIMDEGIVWTVAEGEGEGGLNYRS